MIGRFDAEGAVHVGVNAADAGVLGHQDGDVPDVEDGGPARVDRALWEPDQLHDAIAERSDRPGDRQR